METICLKCLDKEPSRRYASAKELAGELRRYLDGKPIRARPLGPTQRLWRWCRRRPVVAGLAASLLVTLVVGSAISSFFAVLANQRAREATDELWNAYLAQARAERRSGRPGQRFGSLAAIAAAAAIRPASELRDEAIASMAMVDLRLRQKWRWEREGDSCVQFDPSLDYYAGNDGQGNIRVWRVDGNDEVCRFPGHAYREDDLLFSHDSQFLAYMDSAGSPPECHLLDIGQGRELWKVVVAPGRSPWTSPPIAAPSPSSERLDQSNSATCGQAG